jgi:predicted TIM-barrel fold metal-dependent hydrolase
MAAPAIFDAGTLFGPWPQHASDLSLDALLQSMAASNVARSLITATTGIFYDHRQGNAETFEAARRYPQQLFPVGTLDPRAYPECLHEAEARAGEGFRLFRFFPDRQCWPIRYAPFRELLQRCDALKVPIAVAVSHPGEITELADATTFTQAPLLLSGVTPDLLGEALSVMRADGKFYIETTHLLAPGVLEAIRDAMPHGADRLVFASYAPLRYFSAALGPVVTSTLNEEHKANVLGGNLKRLLTR